MVTSAHAITHDIIKKLYESNEAYAMTHSTESIVYIHYTLMAQSKKSVGNANFAISDTFVGTSGPWGNIPDSHMESDRRRGQEKMGI